MLIIGASVSDKIKLIKEAVSWHSKLVREAATGTTNILIPMLISSFSNYIFSFSCYIFSFPYRSGF